MTTISLLGGEALTRKLEEIARRVARPATLRVGFLEGATYPDGTSVAMVAAINNFGAPAKGIPARPFFTNMIKECSPKWGEQLANLLELNDWDVNKSLSMMGEGIAGQLRESITNLQEPPNSPVTNLLKQRFPQGGQSFDDVLQAWADVADGQTDAPAGKPLVWSGQMLNSIDYEIEE